MNPDTAELAIVEQTRPTAAGVPRLSVRLGAARMAAVRDSWQALWRSRVVIWVVTLGTLLAFGFGPLRKTFDPPGVTGGFGRLGDLLAAPAARWDSAWYLVIAHSGYHPELGQFTAPRTAFFPLYPLGMRGLSLLGLPLVLAGVAISLIAFAAALYGIHRLTTLELGGAAGLRGRHAPVSETARLAVLVTAFTPMAYYFSAVYSESLYLALSVALFWCARQGRWPLVGALGALATATRNTGMMLALPALIIYLYGPREDRPADVPVGAGLRAALLPRYRVRRDVAWLVLMPAGFLLYGLFLQASGGGLLSPFHAEQAWGRHLVGPLIGAWDGVRAAFDGALQLLSFQRQHVYFAPGAGSPFVVAGHNLINLAFVIAALPAAFAVLRTLPVAYGVYVLLAIAMPLSYPVLAEPLMSLPRFMVVLFPLHICVARWLASHPRARAPALIASAALMACCAAQFATWHWVA